MPIVNVPIVEEVVQPNIERAPDVYIAPVVDTRIENYDTLATFAAGSKWACDYFSQVAGLDTAPAAYAQDKLVIYGTFRRIRGFELIVTSPFTPTQTSSPERNFEVTGSANVYSVITPNEGDVFIADVGDGRNGVFTVTRTVRSAPYTESFTNIEFRQIRMLDPATEADLNSRVVETLYFDREMMRNGIKPLLKQGEVDLTRKLNQLYRKLTNIYIHEFFDTKFNTLMIPRQVLYTYDPFIVHFVRRVLDQSVCGRLRDVLELNVSSSPTSRVLTLLDAIETVDDSLLYSTSNRYLVVDISQYKTHPYMNSVYYSGIKQVISLTDIPYTNDTYDQYQIVNGELSPGGVKSTLINDILPVLSGTTQVNTTNTGIPYIHPVLTDDYYIFTKAFYEDSEDQSALENIVRSRLRQEAFDIQLLSDIAAAADRFDNLERFYYIPIILAMIKMVPGVL